MAKNVIISIDSIQSTSKIFKMSWKKWLMLLIMVITMLMVMPCKLRTPVYFEVQAIRWGCTVTPKFQIPFFYEEEVKLTRAEKQKLVRMQKEKVARKNQIKEEDIFGRLAGKILNYTL